MGRRISRQRVILIRTTLRSNETDGYGAKPGIVSFTQILLKWLRQIIVVGFSSVQRIPYGIEVVKVMEDHPAVLVRGHDSALYGLNGPFSSSVRIHFGVPHSSPQHQGIRSEERRVGKESRSRCVQ